MWRIRGSGSNKDVRAYECGSSKNMRAYECGSSKNMRAYECGSYKNMRAYECGSYNGYAYTHKPLKDLWVYILWAVLCVTELTPRSRVLWEAYSTLSNQGIGSLPYSQEPLTFSYPEPDQSIPRHRPISWRYVPIFPAIVTGVYPIGLPTKPLCAPALSPIRHPV